AGTTGPTGPTGATGTGPTGPTGPTGSGGGGARSTYGWTTASLANNAVETSNTFPIAKSFIATKVAVSAYARVRLYSTLATATADASRAFTTLVAIGTQNELIMDVQLDSAYGSLSFILSPAVTGSNMEGSPSSNISYNITNLSGSPAAITVTITALSLES